MVSRADKPMKMAEPKPTLRVTDSDLPDIKNMEVGKKYHVKAHIEMQHHSQGDEYGYEGGKSKKHRATFIIHSIKADNFQGGTGVKKEKGDNEDEA